MPSNSNQYGSMRSSRTASKAMRGQPEVPEFNGIPTLPNAPMRPLQGGMGQVWANGQHIADSGLNQRKTHGLMAMPDIQTAEGMLPYKGGRDAYQGVRQAQRRNIAMENNQYVVPDVRAFDPVAVMNAEIAQKQGVDPTSEQYAQLLLGNQNVSNVPNMPMSAYPEAVRARNAARMPQPTQAAPYMQPQALPPNDMGLRAQVPMFDDAVGNPTAGPFMPTSNDGFAPGLLDNPFADRPSLSRADIPMQEGPYAPAQPTQADPNAYPYALPQYNDAQNLGFYSGLDDIAMRGLQNKRDIDEMRRADWNRDNRVRAYDEFAGGVLNPLASMFVKDPTARGRMLSGGQQQMYRYDQQRQLRNKERGQQFDEDKYYTNAKMQSDPNYFPNWIDQQAMQTNRMNAQTGWRNSQNMQAYRQGILDARGRDADVREYAIQQREAAAQAAEERKLQELAMRKLLGEGNLDARNRGLDIQQSLGQGNLDARNRGLDMQQRSTDARIQQINAGIEEARRKGDTQQMLALLKQQQLIAELSKTHSDGTPVYGPEAWKAFGLEAPAAPEQQKPKGFFERLMPTAQPAASPIPANAPATKSKASNPMNLSPKSGAAKPKLTKAQVLEIMKQRKLM